MTRSLRFSFLTFALVVGASACGSSSTTTAATTATTAAPATTAAAPATTAAAATTAAPAAAGPAAPACTGLASAGTAASSLDVSLSEWKITTAPTVKTGLIGFNIKNAGANNHELVVIKADSFDALPKLANGAVDESKLGAGALIGRTEKLGGGKGCATTLNLAPGKYVMVCNIQFGAISHAAKGQKVEFEVTA